MYKHLLHVALYMCDMHAYYICHTMPYKVFKLRPLYVRGRSSQKLCMSHTHIDAVRKNYVHAKCGLLRHMCVWWSSRASGDFFLNQQHVSSLRTQSYQKLRPMLDTAHAKLRPLCGRSYQELCPSCVHMWTGTLLGLYYDAYMRMM